MALKISLELDQEDVTRLVCAHLQNLLGPDFPLGQGDVKIEVKSKQNYKSEWESASFRARVEKTT